jgi:hypothetical protein
LRGELENDVWRVLCESMLMQGWDYVADRVEYPGGAVLQDRSPGADKYRQKNNCPLFTGNTNDQHPNSTSINPTLMTSYELPSYE